MSNMDFREIIDENKEDTVENITEVEDVVSCELHRLDRS